MDLFIPHSLLDCGSSGVLYGNVNRHGDKVIVCCVVLVKRELWSTEVADRLCKLADNGGSSLSPFQSVGFVRCGHPSKYSNDLPHEFAHDSIWFELHVLSDQSRLKVKNVYLNGENVSSKHVRIVLFTAGEFIDSQLLMVDGRFNGGSGETFVDYLVSSFTNVSVLKEESEKCLSICVPPELSQTSPVMDFLKKSCYALFFRILLVFEMCFQNVLRIPSVVKRVLLQSSLCQQLCQWGILINAVAKEAIYEQNISLRSWNVVSAGLLDIACGAVSVYFLWDFLVSEELFLMVMSFTHDFVKWLESLVNWLMGDPAGLKLNIPLNTIIGHIFLYHIHLWETYITVILPVFSACLTSLPFIGTFGLTLLLSAVNDLISLVTIHIYCFYGYMARLYYYHVRGLSSLWRLFRGKRWNPETRRVESYKFDVHQLYVGTLLFTVLVFLLPTVIVYYIVFAVLRLLVLVLQGVISKIINFLTIFPLCVILLRLFKSEKTAGDINFSVAEWAETVVLSLQIVQLPLSTVIRHTLPTLEQFSEVLSWRELLSCLYHGKIIYPI